MVGSQGELAMRSVNPAYDEPGERLLNGRIDGTGTVRARLTGRFCNYDYANVETKLSDTRKRNASRRASDSALPNAISKPRCAFAQRASVSSSSARPFAVRVISRLRLSRRGRSR
jgi:hypothetical protein